MSIIILIGGIIFVIGLIAFFCGKELAAQILCIIGVIILFTGIFIEYKGDNSVLSYNTFLMVKSELL